MAQGLAGTPVAFMEGSVLSCTFTARLIVCRDLRVLKRQIIDSIEDAVVW